MSSSADNGSRIRLRYALARDAFSLDVDATLSMHGITGVFGPSGAGKTTLLRCMAGLEIANESEFVIAGETLDDTARGVCRATHERGIGYVFQEPRLFPHLDVRGNLDYGRRRTRHDADYSFDEIVDLLGLRDLLARRPDGLSGGEAQRVAIGRALLRAPRLLLMDEPVVSLDAARRAEVLPFLDGLHADARLPVLYVSHNVDEICRLCDQLLVIDGGRSLAHGALADVLMRTDLPVLAGEEAGSVVDATCVGSNERYDLSEVTVSAGTMQVSGRYAAGTPLRLRLRANDVSVCREMPEQTSILNVLPATVERIDADSSYSALVHLKAGDDRLLSRITRLSVEHLALEAGQDVFVQIKAVSVRRG